MSEPILVILAAGLSMRYGGMKQIDGIGSHGEPIIDFSIYDAYRAGFRKVVLIIRREHEALFRKALTDEIEPYMDIEFAFQEIDDLPEGIAMPEGRMKPWGTTQALLSCRNQVDAPFAICNADDFYGRNAFEVMYDFLKNKVEDGKYAMIGYPCGVTLGDNGTVTRGICEMDEDRNLLSIREIRQVGRFDGKVQYVSGGEYIPLDPDTPVSMNFWGFTPKVFEDCAKILQEFLPAAIAQDPYGSEHVIPTAVGTMLERGICSVKVLTSSDRWFGVTYKEDKPKVVKAIEEMKRSGRYPDHLW
ncbi:MAG: nucleotidyltransferase [Solobacterium sp.]|nr:nucleotidyltransferase [Solobacterium sp.]